MLSGACVGAARKATISRREQLELDEWLEHFLRQNSGGFQVLLEACGGDIEAAGERLLEVGSKEPNPRHVLMREEIRRRRARSDQDQRTLAKSEGSE